MKIPDEISRASSDTTGKKSYNPMLRRSPTFIGKTHIHGEPGKLFVNGSVHVKGAQSELGGGGGNACKGGNCGAIDFLGKELVGEGAGERFGLPSWLDGIVEVGEGTGASPPSPGESGACGGFLGKELVGEGAGEWFGLPS